MRIFTVSDIHTDYDQNRLWVEKISRHEFSDDVLIVAGDISDSLELIQACFEALIVRFKYVFFAPGNHDLWVNRCSHLNSIQKYEKILEMATSVGVICGRRCVDGTDIVPLQSWYDYSFGRPDARLMHRWMDYYNCCWPDALSTNEEVCRFFLGKNTNLYPGTGKIISFSHFLPRNDLIPFFIPKQYSYLYPILGSWALDQQIRTLNSDIHIYGHSHVNQDMKIEGVRYINNAYGYPSEYWNAKNLMCIIEL